MNRRSRNRGSTLLLVLAMLSILFLIGAALSYSTRLEGQASANYGELTQARMAAATGLPVSMPLIAMASQGVTSTLQPWYTAPTAWSTAARATNGSAKSSLVSQAAALRSVGLGVHATSAGFHSAPQSMFGISDLSSRVNLNTVRSEEALARYLKAVYPNGGSATQRAKILIEARGGEDVSTSPLRLDLRRKSSEPRIENLAEIKSPSGRGKGSVFSETELRTVSNYLTVFSQSPELLNLSTTNSIPKLPMDSITAEAALEKLRAAFPGKDERLLMQFAANVGDFADVDDVPNRLGGVDGAPNSPDVILGVEQTPLITEVYPDSASLVTQGDEGQFIEISNPWNKNLVLAGWSLKVAGGGAVSLNLVLPPGGRVIITDNYDQPAEDAPPETGSFLSIFGARKDDALRKVVVNGGLEIPDRDSYVTLEDAAGNLVDVFSYGNTGTMDSRISFQRDDPRLRVSTPANATPFADPNGGQGSQKMLAAAAAWQTGNTGVISPTDLFNVSTAFVGAPVARQVAGMGMQAAAGQPYPWQMPTLTVEDKKPDDGVVAGSTNFDLRLLDVFTDVAATSSTEEVEQEAASQNPVRNRASFATAAAAQRARNTAFQPRRPTSNQAVTQLDDTPSTASDSTTGTRYAYGKINLNTCTKSALLALEVQLNGQAWPDNSVVEKFESYRLRKLADKEVPFLNVSDFIAEFFPELKPDQLPAVASLLQQVTVNSSAFEIVAENRRSAEEMADSARNGSKRRAAVARSRWTVAMDEKPYSLLNFVNLP